MKIVAVRSFREDVRLKKPYTIATGTFDAVALFFVEIETDRGPAGLGSASPAEDVTGESAAACETALSEESLGWLVGADPRRLGVHCRRLAEGLRAAPAARAAVDMALHDLVARVLGVPLVDFLGRCHDALPTSVTLGIQSVEATLADAGEFLAQGFTCLKVKVGDDLEADLERLRKLRERVGGDVVVRVDANQGYSLTETWELGRWTERLGLEMVEQPLAAGREAELAGLPQSMRRRVAADESLHGASDAFALARDGTCGIWNVKLMKCGGVSAGLGLARLAEAAGVELMWGSMDESRLSIAAAIAAAYASPATRYLDLDGSFDLARDPAAGGFTVDRGRLRPLAEPGLGVRLS